MSRGGAFDLHLTGLLCAGVTWLKLTLWCCHGRRPPALPLFASDVLFCHRPDPDTPIEETVRAMNWVINQVRSGALAVLSSTQLPVPTCLLCWRVARSICTQAKPGDGRTNMHVQTSRQ